MRVSVGCLNSPLGMDTREVAKELKRYGWYARPLDADARGQRFGHLLDLAHGFPELWSAAGSLKRETDGEPLKRSSFGEPSVHCEVEKAENGTMPPCAVRTYQRFTPSASMRKGASPWTKTFFTRPEKAVHSISRRGANTLRSLSKI
jgi:hypothetical protein